MQDMEYRARFGDGSERRYEMVTFHPSTHMRSSLKCCGSVIQHKEEEEISEADAATDEGGAPAAAVVDLVRYEVVPGVFKPICRRAALDPDNRYALFINEINRGTCRRSSANSSL
jgi:hypothetical protein